MSKLHPVPKICQVKSQSLDYLANEVPLNLRGWMAVVESPQWFAWPIGPTTKTSSAAQQQECKFLEASLKKGKGVFFFAKRGVYLASKELFRQGEGFFPAPRGKNCNKKGLMCTNPCKQTEVQKSWWEII